MVLQLPRACQVDLEVHGLLRSCIAGDDVRELGGIPIEDVVAEVPGGLIKKS